MTFYVYLLHNPRGNIRKFSEEALSEAKISRNELYIRMLLLRAQVDLYVADENWGDSWSNYAELANFTAEKNLRWYHNHGRLEWAEANLARGELDDKEQAREILK